MLWTTKFATLDQCSATERTGVVGQGKRENANKLGRATGCGCAGVFVREAGDWVTRGCCCELVAVKDTVDR